VGASELEIEELYRRRYVAFRNVIATVAGGREPARDVVQDAFAQALRRRETYQGTGSLEAWVWRIAFRLALAAVPRDLALIESSLEEAFLEPERDPDLVDAIRSLPPRRRLVVFLRYFGDLSYDEIAETCGISEGTVAATLAQARADLLAAIDREGAEK
jgi:RNA polymerase sigma-70 factor (ECF subfamily)